MRLALAVAALGLGVAACGGSPPPAGACSPGMTLYCGCPNAQTGTQICRSDYTLTPCSCLGNPGTGGGSGAAGGSGFGGGLATAGGFSGTGGGSSTSSDVTPPQLVSLSYTPTSANTTNGSQLLTFTATIADDLSGVSTFELRLTSPSGNQTRTAFASSTNRVSGTAQNGSYSFQLTMPQFSEAGAWKLSSAYLRDVIGNSKSLVPSDLTAAGAQTTFTVTSNADTTPPQLTMLGLSPSSVNTTSASATLTFTATLTDDLSGVSTFELRLTSPSGNQSRTAFASSTNRVSGSAQSGGYSFMLTMPQFSEAGTWTLSSAYLRDVIGNSKSLTPAELTAIGAPASFTVVSTADVTPPALTALAFTPSTLNTSGSSATMTFTATLTDDLSGLSTFELRLTSPSGNQSRTAFASSTNRVSGTAQNGGYGFQVTMPQFSETGTWRLSSAYLRDIVGNSRSLTPSDLTSAGAPTTFVVQ